MFFSLLSVNEEKKCFVHAVKKSKISFVSYNSAIRLINFSCKPCRRRNCTHSHTNKHTKYNYINKMRLKSHEIWIIGHMICLWRHWLRQQQQKFQLVWIVWSWFEWLWIIFSKFCSDPTSPTFLYIFEEKKWRHRDILEKTIKTYFNHDQTI